MSRRKKREKPPEPSALELAADAPERDWNHKCAQQLEDALNRCPGCLLVKPPEAYSPPDEDDDYAGPVICRECEKRGVMLGDEDPFPELSKVHKTFLRVYFHTGNLRGACRAAGIRPRHGAYLLEGKRKPEVRAAFQFLLQMNGLDVFSIARGLRAATNAVRAQWNPATESFDQFPDENVRMRTHLALAKIHELVPKAEKGTEVGVAVTINTNLGDGTSAEKSVEGPVYEAEARVESGE